MLPPRPLSVIPTDELVLLDVANEPYTAHFSHPLSVEIMHSKQRCGNNAEHDRRNQKRSTLARAELYRHGCKPAVPWSRCPRTQDGQIFYSRNVLHCFTPCRLSLSSRGSHLLQKNLVQLLRRKTQQIA